MVRKKVFVLPDTNILVTNAVIIDTLIKRGFCVVVPVTVLSELDKYKYHKELGYNVREASRLIEQADKRNDGSINLTNKKKAVRVLT
ncbi:MAG TPA: hypothetical protein GX691_06085 [Clostridia bacterium]|jgi:predicted ribonuclease YlaK|nr:hypothetical protein [Clostridia bacterium]